MKIVKVKSSQGCLGKNNGCEKAPDLIVDELSNFSINEGSFKVSFDVSSVNVSEDDIEKTNEEIFSSEGDIFIGGDHSITYPSFRSFAKKFSNPGLVIFDAHPDCVNNFKPPSHEDFVRVLVESNIVKSSNLILIGIRKIDEKELSFLKEKGISYFVMKDINGRLNEVCDCVMAKCRSFDGLYVSIDIDVLDPAFAPGTGYLEAGGFSVNDLLYFLRRFKLLNVQRWDLVEVNPDLDFNNITVKVGAKILSEIF